MPIRTEVLMGTLVTIDLVGPGTPDYDDAIDRAFGWFREIEARCTRFDDASELRQLPTHVGVPVAGAPSCSRRCGSPCVLRRIRAARSIRSARRWPLGPRRSYRDIAIDAGRQTVTLLRPLTLDLGAVAKGLAVDAAARELAPYRDFAIDAGGDLYLGGATTGVRGPSASATRDV